MALVIHNGEKIVIMIINAHSFRWVIHLTTTVNCIYIISIEWSKNLWGSWVWKPSHILCFLFVGNRLQPPWPSLHSQGQVKLVANWWRERMQRKGRISQEKKGSLGVDPGFPSRDAHKNIFELVHRTKTSTKWKHVSEKRSQFDDHKKLSRRQSEAK